MRGLRLQALGAAWAINRWKHRVTYEKSMQHEHQSGNGYKLEKERGMEGRGASYATAIKATSSFP